MNAEGVVAKREAAHPYPKAASVRLFLETHGDDPHKSTLDAGRTLTAGERSAIEATMSVVTWKERPTRAACCNPHHFLRYYDAKGRQIGEIAVCFCCGCIESKPLVPASLRQGELDFDYDALKKVIEDMGVRTDFECE